MATELDDLKKDMYLVKETLLNIQLETVRAQGKLEALNSSIEELENDLEKLRVEKVSLTEFTPVQKVTYGVVSAILLAFLTSVIALVTPDSKPYSQPSEVLMYGHKK